MNKYIITHEKIKMQNREEQDFIVSALYNQGKKMIEREMGKTSINEQDQEGKRMNGMPHLFAHRLFRRRIRDCPSL